METTNYTILDGGMGTMLQAAGLPVGQLPEVWNLTNPEQVARIQRKYVEAGAQVIYANTFGANRHKVAASGYTPKELIAGGIQAARAAAGDCKVKVALDVGPIGQLLEPLGTMSFDEAYNIYKEMVVAGEEAGADLVIFETMSDLYEVKAAVLAARENTSLPVWVTMTFEATGRTFVGVTVPAMALTLTGLGVEALGFNCSLGPRELLPMVEELRQWTDLPMILKPNAGLPDPATGAYTITPEEFAEEMAPAAELGVQIMGGCCGTTPDFIRALSGKLADRAVPARPKAARHGVCSPTCVAELNGVRVIGERINPTGKKRFQQALREWDMSYILEKGMEQQDAGAEILDVNVGLPGIDEAKMMTQVVKNLQPVVELPPRADGKLDVGGAVGRDGTLSVVKDLGMKEPYVGQVPLVSGEIAEDITAYYAVSEQTPTVCALGVLVDRDLSILTAGGYLLQLLPGASDAEITHLEQNVAALPSVTELLRSGASLEQIMEQALAGFAPNVLDEQQVRYQCDCSQARVERALLSLGRDELAEMAAEGKPVEVSCHFCDKKYYVDAGALLGETKG